MKFMLTWQMHEGMLHETLSVFAHMTVEQEKALMGDEVKLLGRWHDLIRGAGVAIYEAKSAEALSAYALNWNKFMDLDIAPVVDDDDCRTIGQQAAG